MRIVYDSRKTAKLFDSSRELKKKYSDAVIRVIQRRLAQLQAVETLEEMRSIRWVYILRIEDYH